MTEGEARAKTREPAASSHQRAHHFSAFFDCLVESQMPRPFSGQQPDSCEFYPRQHEHKLAQTLTERFMASSQGMVIGSSQWSRFPSTRSCPMCSFASLYRSLHTRRACRCRPDPHDDDSSDPHIRIRATRDSCTQYWQASELPSAPAIIHLQSPSHPRRSTLPPISRSLHRACRRDISLQRLASTHSAGLALTRRAMR